MPIPVSGQVGPQLIASGVTTQPLRQGNLGEVIVTELHGRFYEQVYRGNVFSIGCQLTALAATTILLTSAAQPIVGVWNPATSTVNLVILQSQLQAQQTASTTPPGTFSWAASAGNSALTAGLAPFNRKTLSSVGSQAKAFALSTASLLTGLANNLTIVEPADFTSGVSVTTAAVPATVSIPFSVGIQNFDGCLIVPPGGVLALVNTVSTTTMSVAARVMWEEVPL